MSEEERAANPMGSEEAPRPENPIVPGPPSPPEPAIPVGWQPSMASEEPGAGAHSTTTPPEGEPAAPGWSSPPPASPTIPGGEVDVTASSDDRLMAALAWASMAILQIPLVSLVLLIAEENKKRPFQRFHAVNSILFWIAGFFYEILAAIVFIVLTVISLGCLGLFLWVIFFLPHLAAFYYAYQAYQGKRSEVPFLTELARGQGWIPAR